MNDNETVAEIVSLMRNKNYYRGYMGITYPLTDRMVADIIDRIEAAYNREVAELRECLNEALAYVCAVCSNFRVDPCKDGHNCESITRWRKALERISVIKSEVTK